MKSPMTADAATGKPNSMSNVKNKSILLFMHKKGASSAPKFFYILVSYFLVYIEYKTQTATKPTRP